MEELQNGKRAIVDFPEFDKAKANRQAVRVAIGAPGAVAGYEFTDQFWFNVFSWMDTYYPYILPWPDSWNAGMASVAGAVLGAALAYALGWLNNTMRYRADKKAAAATDAAKP